MGYINDPRAVVVVGVHDPGGRLAQHLTAAANVEIIALPTFATPKDTLTVEVTK